MSRSTNPCTSSTPPPNPTSPTAPPPPPWPTSPPPIPNPAPNTLTCLEDRAEFENLRAAVYTQFTPANYFQKCLADEIAEELWMKRRFSDVANQALSFEIEKAYNHVSQTYPNADPALRTVLAWKELQNDPSGRNALAERTRSTRNYLNLARHLDSARRRK